MLLLVSLGHLSIFLRLIKCHLPFIWIFCFCLFLFPFASLFRFRFGFPFGFPFGFRFGFPFRFLFGFPFGFLFGSDNLISLSYSEAGFSANLFGLFFYILIIHSAKYANIKIKILCTLCITLSL